MDSKILQRYLVILESTPLDCIVCAGVNPAPPPLRAHTQRILVDWILRFCNVVWLIGIHFH
ncbi:hypothetical protein ACRE1S_06735 [Helicobacter himalayensis]|uniref:hypothetical protein n=1 Tax=Helicobacter himalayensis TaxID=1591088 RepID=UPI003D6E0EA5